jgi:hypothetical protein
MTLPEGVERTAAKGRVYYYWNPGRGTVRQGKRMSLPDPQSHPIQFKRELARLRGPVEVNYPAGSVGDLVQRYKASGDFTGNAPSTKASYSIHLRRFQEAWGLLPAAGLTGAAVIELRDSMQDRPGMANHMLSVGRTLWSWAKPLGIVNGNPFEGIADLATDDSGHIPWPAWASDYVCKTAPADLVRLVRLGLATCQRESDLIRLGPEQREAHGVWCRPKKTRKKRKTFNIPLTKADALMLDRWAQAPMTFTSIRWKGPITRHRSDVYLYSPRGKPFTTTSIQARWQRWLNREAGQDLCQRWQTWVAEMVRKYEWDIDPVEATNPTIHGLRGTGILIRFAQGYDIDQIANDIGMSPQMVSRYMRFRDQMEVAAAGQRRLKVVKRTGA